MIDLAIQRLTLAGYSRAQVTRGSDAPLGRPRVSVVVPCYNYGRFLPACLDSILGQQDVDLDVLVVDDASTDGSGEVAEALAADDPRVRVHRNETNLGHIASYNLGFSKVTGDYVLLLSADDMLTSGALARATALLEARPSVGFAYGWSLPFWSGEPLPPARTRTRSWSVWAGSDWVVDRCRRGWNVIRSSDAVIRRSVLAEVGGYREGLPHSADHEWWMRAALVCDVGMVCGVDQLYYRMHGASMSRTTYESVVFNLYATCGAYDAALAGDAPDRVELRRIAHERLATYALEVATDEYMAGRCDDDALGEYRRFAVAADPGIVNSHEWRVLNRREAIGPRRARRSPVFRSRDLVRDLQSKLVWRRWRFSGI